MNTLPGYEVKELLYEGRNSYVYRTYDEKKKCAVVVKILKGDFPSADAIGRLLREYEITRNSDLKGAIKVFSFERHSSGAAIIMEDIGGESLEKIIKRRKFSLTEYLRLAIKITKVIEEIHKKNIIHKDINPSNIIWNPETDDLRLIDFGISTVLRNELTANQNPNILEGTLEYVSPEKTGRMNRMLDYRADMYSLGITFYELLTGQLPFMNSDPMELIHCHIAKDPIPPHQVVNSHIDHEQGGLETISAMIMKLMAKNAEERYQSEFGLLVDLENCLEQLQTTGRINDFEIAKKDYSDRFQISQKLYGREKETAFLYESFERVCKGDKEIMMVTGYAGIGKSALVNEIHKFVVAHRGYFISGKFEQFKKNIPYSSLIQAFRQLIRQILTESEEQIESWRAKILEAVGPNGQVIIDVIPEVELIIGKQPPKSVLPSQESQNRFNLCFKNFIRIFAKKEHPLTIFLDDLQWVDLSSLNLIELFISDSETQYILFIGAYRENEVDQYHSLILMLDKIKTAGITLNNLSLSSLDFENVNKLISDTLKCHPERTIELAKLCQLKTSGNPFFLKQFLHMIYENGLFQFDRKKIIWNWEIWKIERMKITENVVDLMVDKVQKLPESTQSALKMAACLGNQFDLKILSEVCGEIPSKISDELGSALQEQLILPMSDDYKFIHADNENIQISYKFSHDRIQNAVYSLIVENERKRIHREIGQLLLKNAKDLDTEERIFDIANHLNSGIDLIEESSERTDLARINIMAGQRAMTSTAHDIGYQYFATALELLGKNCWRDHYSLTLKAYDGAAETSYQIGDFEKMETFARSILNNTRTLLDRIKINEVIIQSLIARARLKEAVTTAIAILRELGVKIPANPGKLSVLISLTLLRISLTGKRIKYLNALGQMKDEHKLAAMRILMNAASSAYYGNTLMAISMALKMVSLSTRYGNSIFSSYGYGLYGIILHGVVGNIRLGYEYGRFAVDLNHKYNARAYEAKNSFIFNVFIRHWKDKLNTTIEPFSRSHQNGLETGDHEYAAYCAGYVGIHSLHCGLNLEEAENEMRKGIEVSKNLNQEMILFIVRLNRQIALNLMGKAKNRTELVGEDFNEIEILPRIIKDNVITDQGILYTFKGMINYYFGNMDEAFRNARIAEKFREPLIGLLYLQLLYFYNSLIFLCCYPDLNWYDRIYVRFKVFFHQKKIKKWADVAPENQLHRWHLIEAERYSRSKKKRKARDNYNKAIIAARENGYIQDEALANELTARHYLQCGDKYAALNYISEARYLYSKWGAKEKVNQIENEHSELLEMSQEKEAGPEEIFSPGKGTQIETTAEQLDLRTVQKASQIISGEIHLKELIEKLLKILIANAGAERGFVLLMDKNKLFVEGEAFADEEHVEVLQHIPLEKTRNISHMIINYSQRKREAVVLNNATEEDVFSHDEYLVKNQIRSLFCMPLIYQDKISGILYLENNHLTGAFTAQRVEILKMLSGQIIISIENSKLYKDLEEYNLSLEENVEKRTKEISQKNEQLNKQKEELHEALEYLKQSQHQLIQAEKMASLGQLVAGIAHEINNPVTFISAGVDSLKTDLEDVKRILDIYDGITTENLKDKLKEINKLKDSIEYRETVREINNLIDSIKTGTERTTEIIKGLRTFSRLDEDILKIADIHENINSTLVLLRNKYKDRIKIEKKYGDIPQIECYPGQLNQVFMNVLSNAIDAIEEKGIITISTMRSSGNIQIKIRDSGKGIPADLIPKIFEPFFTTKEVGKGTGLGLSISHGIIEKHKGQINVSSKQGEGSEFTIILPIKLDK